MHGFCIDKSQIPNWGDKFLIRLLANQLKLGGWDTQIQGKPSHIKIVALIS